VIMNTAVKRLENTGIALRDALTNQDWAAIGLLDQQCREAVDDAMREVERDSDLKMTLEDILAIYRDLVSSCKNVREGLGEEMAQVNKAHQGAKIYKMFG